MSGCHSHSRLGDDDVGKVHIACPCVPRGEVMQGRGRQDVARRHRRLREDELLARWHADIRQTSSVLQNVICAGQEVLRRHCGHLQEALQELGKGQRLTQVRFHGDAEIFQLGRRWEKSCLQGLLLFFHRCPWPTEHSSHLLKVVLEEARDQAAVSVTAAKATGAPGDLPDLRDVEAPGGFAIELPQAAEGYTTDVKVQPHADGITGHQDVPTTAWIVEQCSLLTTDCWRQGPIDYCWGLAQSV
mmetsp:Transcript_39227/g.84720  ORF Transcript_39227/g.84720 Transcript_39227/m.84720 type:complete len:244 (+) Transcript_39227:55-786(+)